jgi:D-sedoheptulose 7-phosphate isomerase
MSIVDLKTGLSLAQKEKFRTLAEDRIRSSIEVKTKLLSEEYSETLLNMAQAIVASFDRGGKLLLCGNGGSAADAQHLVAELLIRLRSHVDRQALPAIALTMDPSTMTACGNDYGFDHLYERMVMALGNPQDVLLGITTSGKSENVLRALKVAQDRGLVTFGFLGCEGGAAQALCDLSFIVPAFDTAHIQEAHITAGHILIQLVEEIMIENGNLLVE